MRMPDRLDFSLARPRSWRVRLGPMAVLTLVENAVRHGIDPSEAGGRIDVSAVHDGAARFASWSPTPASASSESACAGTGLENLRSRLRGFFGDRARLELLDNAPRGHACRDRLRRGRRAAHGRRRPSERGGRPRVIADDEPLLRERLRAHLGASLARAGDRRRGAQRPRGGRAVRDAPPAGRLPRRPDAGPERRRRGAGDRPARPDRVRHRASAVRAPGLRRRGDRLPGQAVRGQPARRQRGAAEEPPWRPPAAGPELDALLDRLAAALGAQGAPRARYLQWIRASVGTSVRLIPVDQVVFLRSDEKYTLVAWEGGEALIRKSIRELVDSLDPDVFAQIHRSVIVNLRHVAQVDRGFNESAEVRLRGRRETLPVSRSFLHVFRQM